MWELRTEQRTEGGANREKQTRATVAIAHTGEKHRSYETVYRLAEEALMHVGGMRRFVQPASRF